METKRPQQTALIDLHGFSEERAKDSVKHYIREAHFRDWGTIRFVTGRGNHINARGERGTLYKNFKEWLKDSQDKILNIHQYDGYYEVDIKKDITVRNPFSALMNESVKKLLKANIQEIQQAAEKKDFDAMLALANCYDHGIGVEKSYQKATGLYLQLAENTKLPLAQYEAGCRFFIGKGIKQNDDQAIKFLTQAADQDFVLAEFMLAEIYQKGFDAVSIDHSLAVKYYFKAAKHRHAEAARKLGCAYHSGQGISIDLAQAIFWWEKACALGDCVAAFNLSAMYEDGKGVTKDLNKTVHYLKIAAERNDPDGQQVLGFCYLLGEKGITKNLDQGLRWLKLAANNGSVQAQFFLYRHSLSLKKFNVAKEYLTNAALNSHIIAQFLIASSPTEQLENKSENDKIAFNSDFKRKMLECLLKQPEDNILEIKIDSYKYKIIELLLCDDNTKKQVNKAIRILERLAREEKSGESLKRLGEIYIFGGVKRIKKDISRGYKYWQQGAALRDTDCLCSLGYFWYEGFGSKVDYKQALNYFSQAASLGNANANNMLGVFYKEGLCSDNKNIKKAIEHFQLAMELDHPEKRSLFNNTNVYKYATRNLAVIYIKGADNVPKDEAKGIELFKLSAEDGLDESAIFLADYYQEKKQVKEFFYYLNLAAQLGNAKAIEVRDTLPQEFKTMLQQQASSEETKESSKTPVSKEELKIKLKEFSNCLEEKLDWKISNDNCAWAYISDHLQNKLIQSKAFKSFIKKASNGCYLLTIQSIYQYRFDDLAKLFQDAACSASNSSQSADIDSTTGLITQHSFLTNNLTSNGSSERQSTTSVQLTSNMRKSS